MIPLCCVLLFIHGTADHIPDFGNDFIPSRQDNMNGEYPLSTTPRGKPNLMPKQFRDYPGGVESFEVLSPAMTTLYSQVWWSPLAPVDLPKDIVEKYKGKGMAIVGWEIDQVRRTPAGDVSVPMSASYNHHWDSWMIGADASFRKVKVKGPKDPLAAKLMKQQSGCGSNMAWDQPQYLIEGPDQSARGYPTRAALTSGNGGEFRKTFHGFPPGYALVVDSPSQLQISPMNIDTWHREAMNISGPLPPKFVAGPLPRASLAPAGALHSGLLECPMTTRLTKVIDSSVYVFVERDGTCEEPIMTFYECFQAAEVLLKSNSSSLRKEVITDLSRPSGCLVAENTDSGYHVLFNLAADSTSSCSATARCICAERPTPFGHATGALLYHQTNQSADVGRGKAAYFKTKCSAWPATDLLQQQNPTCDIRYYRGGQWACNHMWSLLDADQEIPWTDQPLTFHHKYRFWVQPYKEAYHKRVERSSNELLIGSPWEYDVPACDLGVPGCELVDGQWTHTVKGSMLGKQNFVHLNSHCHAPTCLSTKIYVCPKGTMLQDCNATTGKLVCDSRPVNGGTGNPLISGTRFDEPGYIALADCLWGSTAFGLEEPLDVDGMPLHIVKTTNATSGHYGEMSGTRTWGMPSIPVDVMV
eukprot:TRINITY_DN91702_c0_g1_i1.p1 TRINITY_DN91702_c0_g1~~TRINITY_DN91702_c0_g1_i1.p1  ORF type:complete len:642 (-),score=85.73 TRINITY_DN91702_c0_g1_i1:25-1950(-)